VLNARMRPQPESLGHPDTDSTPRTRITTRAFMRAIVITTPGGPEVLRLEEVRIPCPGRARRWWR